MKAIVTKYNQTSLILRIAIGLIIGVILGYFVPQASFLDILGTLFVGALKSIAPILVFVLVISSLAQARKGIGSQFRTVIFLYMLSTLLAAFVAVIASFLFPVTLQLADAATESAPVGIGEVFTTLLSNLVANPVSALMNANYIGVLFWAVVLGLAFKSLAAPATLDVLSNISDAVSKVVRWIINLAPFGILGLVHSSVSEYGVSIFTTYGKLVLVLVGCMLFAALIVDPFIVFLCLHRNPYPLVFRCLKESGVTAFFTRSSAANIPVNMQLCERLGLDKDMYSVSIPLGATINMDGAAITITIMTLAAAHTLGISVDIPTAFVLSVLATLGACGASGVAGGSLLLIPMACSLFGISNDIAMQVVGVGFIIGVVQDSFETALNSAGDVMFAATAEFRDKLKKGEDFHF
jgi:serine/threonine transporter